MTARQSDPVLRTFVDEREMLFVAAYRIVDNRAVAEELVQESWLRWHGKGYQPSQARALLLRIVKNLAIDWHKKRRTEFEAIETQRLLQDLPHDAERIIGARQQLGRVIRAIESLPHKARLAFRLSRVEGLTLKQAGERLGISESRTSQLVSDAIVRIAAALGE